MVKQGDHTPFSVLSQIAPICEKPLIKREVLVYTVLCFSLISCKLNEINETNKINKIQFREVKTDRAHWKAILLNASCLA